jgi:cholesterol transport system auxiliary component
MTRSAAMRPFLKHAAVGVLALGLASCITLLPDTKPAQLYRFGLAPAAATPSPVQGEAVTVYRAGGQFQREAAGDRILTMTGERAAYIAGARWVVPAEVLFEEAVVTAFERAPGRVRLISRGELISTDFAIRLDVRKFETEYGQGGAPSVLVRVRAVLTTDQKRTALGEQTFEARVPAAENRISAIVAAYDQAIAKVLSDVVAWTNRTAV